MNASKEQISVLSDFVGHQEFEGSGELCSAMVIIGDDVNACDSPPKSAVTHESTFETLRY